MYLLHPPQRHSGLKIWQSWGPDVLRVCLYWDQILFPPEAFEGVLVVLDGVSKSHLANPAVSDCRTAKAIYGSEVLLIQSVTKHFNSSIFVELWCLLSTLQILILCLCAISKISPSLLTFSAFFNVNACQVWVKRSVNDIQQGIVCSFCSHFLPCCFFVLSSY